MADYIPASAAELVPFSFNFKELIVAQPTLYGLTAAQATAYATAHDDFAEAFQAATDPGTRTPAAILVKDQSMKALKEMLRLLARQVQGTPTVTDEQKLLLGLTVRKAEPTPINPPTDSPRLDVVSTVARTVKVRLHDAANPTHRGRPGGVAGAAVFSYVGASAPTDPKEWKFEGNTAKTTFDVEFPDTVASGATVWLTAMWFNAKMQSGPGCSAVSANLPGGSAMAA
jgi:hypothetical protein